MANETLAELRAFNKKPHEIYEYLDRFVIKQEEAKRLLSVAVCDHYNHVRMCLEDPEYAQTEHTKQNVILLGPSGSGKTYLIRCLAKLIGVPFTKADATKFAATGYVGHHTEELARDLVRIADQNVELAQYGIIYVDEIDKIAGTPEAGGRDVGGKGVQVNMLKLMEKTEIPVNDPSDMLAQVELSLMIMNGAPVPPPTINTKHMLFIVSGAFVSLDGIIKDRLATRAIGFGHSAKDEKQSNLAAATTADFIKFGFEPEFIGRLPVRVALESLAAEDLKSILLKSEGSILKQYVREMQGYGIELEVTDDGATVIAEKASSEGTGARGLVTVIERTLRNFKFELPSTSIKELRVDGEVVRDPDKALSKLLDRD